MSNTNGSHSKILIFLVLLLIVVVAIQSYYLFRTHNRLIEFLSEKPLKLSSSSEKTISPPSSKSGTLFNEDWMNKPFDPDKWNPFNEMEQMQQDMNHMFDNALGRFDMSPRFQNMLPAIAFSPKLDMEENDNEFVIRMDLPGMDKGKIDVEVKDQVLTVKGKREEVLEQPGKEGKTEIRERRMGEFERSITLPAPVDSAHMQTKYDNGILVITLPKAQS